MLYVLNHFDVKRCGVYIEIMLDLWNYKFDTGYEIKIALNRYPVNMGNTMKYCRELLGQIHDITEWDKIIYDMKRNESDKWGLYSGY